MNQLPGCASGDPVTNSVWTVPVAGIDADQRPAMAVHARLRGRHRTATRSRTSTTPRPTTTPRAADHRQRRLHPGRHPGQDRVRAARREHLRRHPGRPGQLHHQQHRGRTPPTTWPAPRARPCSVTSPTFWTADALTGITTQSLVGGSLQTVDSYALTDTYPATGDSTTSPVPVAVLDHPHRPGRLAVDHAAADVVRGHADAEPGPDRRRRRGGYSLITRFRLTAITSETGGVTTIAYSAGADPGCAAGNFPAPDQHRRRATRTTGLQPGSSSPGAGLVQPVPGRDGHPDRHHRRRPAGGDRLCLRRGGVALRRRHRQQVGDPTWDQWRGFRTVTTETGTVSRPGDRDGRHLPPGHVGRQKHLLGPAATATGHLTSSRGDHGHRRRPVRRDAVRGDHLQRRRVRQRGHRHGLHPGAPAP